MAAPVPYVPSYSFDGFQLSNPTKPLPGARLDDQLADIALSTGQLVTSLSLIQRSDGKLVNGIVTPDALSTQILAGLNEPTPWTTGVSYAVSATVFQGPKLYICGVAHVSGVFATDLAAGKWTQLADFTPSGIIDSASVIFVPGGSGLVATNVQAAIYELDTYIDQLFNMKASTSSLGALAFLSTVASARIDDKAVTLAKLADAPALSIPGRAGNSVGVRTDIVADNDGHVFRRDGSVLAFGQIKSAGIEDRAVTPAKQASHGGFPGQASKLAVNVTSNSAVAVTASALVVADSNGNTRTLRNVSLTLDLGAGGLDTGTEAPSTWYYVHVFYNDATATGTLRASISATAPTAPAGFNFSARVGAVRNDASSNLWRTFQRGRRVQITTGVNPSSAPRAASGSAGSGTAVSLLNFVPPTAISVDLSAKGQNNSYMSVSPANTSPAVEWSNSNTAVTYATFRFSLLLESSNIYWQAGGGAFIDVGGWEDSD